jgi:hypothetical protein
VVSGEITKLALVRLDATAVGGSEIFLQADKIIVDGQTTFLNSLKTNGIARTADVSTTIRSATAPTLRDDGTAIQAGDTWIKTDAGNLPHTYDGRSPFNVNGWIRDYTQIDGGLITTGTVDTNRLNVSNIITVGSISTEAYADGVAASALSDAEDYADGVTETVSDATPRIFRQDTAPTTSNRSDSSLQDGDLWFDTDDGDAPYVYNASIPNWIPALTQINGNRITTGIINAGVVSIQNESGTTPNVKINSTGITLKQIDASTDTEVSRSIHWINPDSLPNQSRIISYASGSNIAVDVAGTEQTGKDFRFSVRRDIDGVQDLSIGIVGNAGSFVSGSAVGDAVVSVSNGILWLNDTVRATSSLTANSLIVGTQTNKATIFYNTNTARTLSIPNVGGNRTFAFINQAQTFSAAQTFSSSSNSFTGTYKSSDNTLGATDEVDTGAVILNFKNGLFVGTS